MASKGRDLLGFIGLGGVGGIPPVGGFRSILDAALGGVGLGSSEPTAVGGFSMLSIATGTVGIWSATEVSTIPAETPALPSSGGGGIVPWPSHIDFAAPMYCDFNGNVTLAPTRTRRRVKTKVKVIRSIVRERVEVPVDRVVYRYKREPYPVFVQQPAFPSIRPSYVVAAFAIGFTIGFGLGAWRSR